MNRSSVQKAGVRDTARAQQECAVLQPSTAAGEEAGGEGGERRSRFPFSPLSVWS